MSGDDDEKQDATEKLPADGAKALENLRSLWSNTGADRAFFAAEASAAASGRSTMEEIIGKVGYDGLDTFEEGEATSDTHAAGQRLQAAWKKTLQREGKMTHPGQSVSDLIAKSREGGLPAPPGGVPEEDD